MSEIKIECPNCQQPIEVPVELARRGLNCPACFKFFVPKNIEPPTDSVPKHSGPPDAWAERDLCERRLKIRGQADKFQAGAWVCFFISVIAFGSGMISSLEQMDGGLSWAVMRAAFGLSVFFYLIVQIIHIRANTER